MNIYYAGKPGDGYGWGVCNRELVKALRGFCNVFSPEHFLPHQPTILDGLVFMPLADHDFNPVSPVRGRWNFAYTFFEFELGPNAARNAARYDVVFCGSTWCLERMRERGITNGRVLIQGVDHEIFKPVNCVRNDTEFRIFSGGKFEYRKGQDIVIAAFRELWRKYPQLRLVCAWHNPWPALIGSMESSPHLMAGVGGAFPKVPLAYEQTETYKRLLAHNGIDLSRCTVLGPLPQQSLAYVMQQTDLGVFPNRCEGGTNLVLMEYLACGKPVVMSCGTGHADIYNALHPDLGEPYRTYTHTPEWDELTPEDVAREIEELMADRGQCDWEGAVNGKAVQQFTWQRAAKTIVETIAEVCEIKGTGVPANAA